MLTGYKHPSYVESFFEYGTAMQLAASRGWLIRRAIPRSEYHDAMGTYPFFVCHDWSKINVDLEQVGSDLVSVVLVTDPFGEYERSHLERCFPDLCKPFKQHYVADLSDSPWEFISEGHRRNLRKALNKVEIEKCERPPEYLQEWVGLYDHLVKRHSIKGIAAFSQKAFSKQLQVPGTTAFRALFDGKTAGMLLWYVSGDIAYYHLGAYSEAGYRCGASFVLFWRAIEYFTDYGVRWLNFGAGAGLKDAFEDGLSRFKRGWANTTRITYLCGRVFRRQAYNEMVSVKPDCDTDYFPKYRKGEFT